MSTGFKMRKNIRILGKTFDIVCIKGHSQGTTLGQLDQKANTILLNACMRPDYMQETLLHEILHQIVCAMGIDLGDDEENIITGISNGLFCVYKENNLKLK